MRRASATRGGGGGGSLPGHPEAALLPTGDRLALYSRPGVGPPSGVGPLPGIMRKGRARPRLTPLTQERPRMASPVLGTLPPPADSGLGRRGKEE